MEREQNLTTDLRARLASLIEPELLARVEIAHIDQLAARVLGENAAPGRGKQRVYDSVALDELRQLLAELDDRRWEPEFLPEEWEQVILGQSVPTRSAYFQARRASRGRALTRPDRHHIWKLVEQFTARLDKRGIEERCLPTVSSPTPSSALTCGESHHRGLGRLLSMRSQENTH